MNSPILTWEAICADRSLRDLPYKIETNRYNKIIMSPASYWHSDYQGEIGRQLGKLMIGGRVAMECAIQTEDGIRVPDVAWISKARRAPHRRAVQLPIAPEICVEIVSFSNSHEEMQEKMRLYFTAGAQEVWLCHEDGRMEFFTSAGTPQQAPLSTLCPDFPRQIDID